MAEKDFNRKEYINEITPCIKQFWCELAQSICAGRNAKKNPFAIKCAPPSTSNTKVNHMYPVLNESIDAACKRVLGNRVPQADNIYAHNFYLTISGAEGQCKRILLETWQLSWEDKPYSTKYEAVPDQFENLLKIGTLTSMFLPLHPLTVDNLDPPFDCSFYTYHYCTNGAAIGCALPAGRKKEVRLVGQVRTKVSQLSLHVVYVEEIDLNSFADEVKAMEIIPSPDKGGRGEGGSSPELQFMPDDIVQLRKDSDNPQDSLQEKSITDQAEGLEKSARGSMLDITCAFASGDDPISEGLKKDIIYVHQLSKLEDELIESFHKTLSLEKLVEAKKAAEKGMILNEKIGEVLEGSAILDSKLKSSKGISKIGRQSSLPSKSPFSAVPLVKIPDPPRPVDEATISVVSKQLLDSAAAGRRESGAQVFDRLTAFGDDNGSEDLASLYTMFKNAPDINFRAANELQNLDEKFKYFEVMKKTGEELYERVKKQRREQEESDKKE